MTSREYVQSLIPQIAMCPLLRPDEKELFFATIRIVDTMIEKREAFENQPSRCKDNPEASRTEDGTMRDNPRTTKWTTTTVTSNGAMDQEGSESIGKAFEHIGDAFKKVFK